MMTKPSLADLEDTQDRERRAARTRIDSAEEYIGYYRSRIRQVRETFYNLAVHKGAADYPDFQEHLRRVGDVADENVAHAGRKVGELEERYDAMVRDQYEERERLFAGDKHS